VRLTERCVREATAPFTEADRASVVAAVRQAFGGREPAFRFALPRPATAVATGGTVTTVRAMLAAALGGNLSECGASVGIHDLETLLTQTAALPLAARRELPGLPATRADVFPTALATIIEVAHLASVDHFTHSLYNLRYGIAAELLGDSCALP
jgi:exopolyphosphatase/guanosine-5'-triphosphate,3'-diphosphate pyrophosphatase